MTLSTDFIAELRKHFTGDIRLDRVSRILYSTDASIYQIEPLGVLIPRNQEDLIAAVEIAARFKVPVLPRGSGSSLAGQAIGQAVILDCSRFLDHMPEGINRETLTAVVEPGVILANLNREAAKYGLMFGPDPASAERATMGGVLGNNATGAHSIMYGMTADHILSADVVMADGSLATWGLVDGQEQGVNSRLSEVIAAAYKIREELGDEIKNRWPKTWRNSAGYRLNYLIPWSSSRPERWVGEEYPPKFGLSEFNLAALLAGSEGTLAVIRSATIKLVSKPKHTILGVLSYESVAAACDAVPGLLRTHPSAIELIPKMLIRLARSLPAYSSQLSWVRGDPAALLVIEYSGDEKNNLLEKAKMLGSDVLIAESNLEQSRVWAVRKVGLGIIDSQISDKRPVAFIEDCAIPVENLGEFVRQVEKILTLRGAEAAFYAHASAGCLHIRPILNLRTNEGVRDLKFIAKEVLSVTLSVGGSMSSEHGDGIVRAEWLDQIYGQQILTAMQILKRTADPEAILNPNKMWDAPSMDLNLRFGADYQTKLWNPIMQFEGAGGINAAIEQCNGQGVCRKLEGFMCPSFQVTREEVNSTRGRANLLRALISVGSKGLLDEQVKEALDLCLACKGCKFECPTGVDMAKIKYEFQFRYYQDHSRPIRDYLFGYINILARLGAPFGYFVNWLSENAISRKIINSIFGISGMRKLPRFGKTLPFNNQTNSHKDIGANFTERCLLLTDTFTHYFEPNVEKAAVDVLVACGVEIKSLKTVGAGRTLLSKGFVQAAQKHAIKLLDEIKRLDPAGKFALIGLEPSEIYTIRDEVLALLPERRVEIEALVSRTWLIDEYLIRGTNGNANARLDKTIRKKNNLPIQIIRLHGHCYQKAQPPHPDGFPIGLNATATLLRKSGFEVEIIESGCCGMAGAFGYEAEHYEISMAVAELKLFPEVRKTVGSKETVVVANGTSCRSQIEDGTGVKANHSIVLVAQKIFEDE